MLLNLVHFIVVMEVDFYDDVEVVEVVVLWLLLWHVDDDLVVWEVCEKDGLRKGILMEGLNLFLLCSLGILSITLPFLRVY